MLEGGWGGAMVRLRVPWGAPLGRGGGMVVGRGEGGGALAPGNGTGASTPLMRAREALVVAGGEVA